MTETVSGSGQALTIPPGHAYSAESLRSYADRVAPGWHVAHKPEGAGSFGRRIDATAQSLERGLRVLLGMRAAWPQLGAAAAASVAGFSATAMAGRYEQLYRRWLAQRSPAGGL